jgi:hypothetical protein
MSAAVRKRRSEKSPNTPRHKLLEQSSSIYPRLLNAILIDKGDFEPPLQQRSKLGKIRKRVIGDMAPSDGSSLAIPPTPIMIFALQVIPDELPEHFDARVKGYDKWDWGAIG